MTFLKVVILEYEHPFKYVFCTFNNMKKLLLLLLFISFFSVGQSKVTELKSLIESDVNTHLNDSLLKLDFNLFSKIVCETSPNLNLKEKEDLYSYYNKRSEKLNGKTMTVIDFFKFLIDKVGDAKLDEHASIDLSEEVMKELFNNKKILFPVPIIILNDKLIVNHENVQIPFGSVISEINGISVEAILDEIIREKSTYQLRQLEPSFDVLYFIKYGTPKTFNVTYSLPNAIINKTIEISPVDITTRKNIYKKVTYPLNRAQLKNHINTEYFVDSDSFYIQLNSFEWNKQVENIYKAFDNQFKSIFKTIKKQKPKNLIIDLRYNRGGKVVIPALFYSYISQENFNEYISIRVPDFDLPAKNNILSIDNKNVTSENIENFLTDIQKPFTKKNDYYQHVFINNIKKEKKKRRFNGKVFLLVGGVTFSAAAYYTAIFKSNKRGKIIGEQVGGSHHNITAGNNIVYELPNSKIKLSMPLGFFKFSKDIETNVPEENIDPDILVSDELIYSSFLKKEDWSLKAVFDLIKKQLITEINN